MRWLNPAAFAGLALLLVPLIAHLLTRHHARVIPFPTLRFLPRTPLVPTRLTRPTDLLLLAVRMSIIAAAVLALARPQFAFFGGTRGNGSTARVVLVDTSASMRAPVGLSSVRDSAQRVAQAIADSSPVSIVVMTDAPATRLAAAASWLLSQESSAHREIVVVSDFQVVALAESDVVALPEGVGLRLIALRGTSDNIARIASAEYDVTIRILDSATSVRVFRRAKGTSVPLVPHVFAPASDSEIDALRRAVGGSLLVDSAAATRSAQTEIAFAGSAEYSEWSTAASVQLAPQHAELIRKLRADSTLVRVARSAVAVGSAEDGGVPVLRNEQGTVVVTAYPQDDAPLLRLAANVHARSPTALALLAAATVAQSTTPAPNELDTRFVSTTVLRQWERPAIPQPAVGVRNDGRWFWLLVLLLLGVETYLRRRTQAPLAPTAETLGRAAA